MTFDLDPADVLDFEVNWAERLAEGEQITSHTATPSDGITVDSSTVEGSTVTVWVSGGEADTRQQVVVHIVTDQGREADATLHFVVEEK